MKITHNPITVRLYFLHDIYFSKSNHIWHPRKSNKSFFLFPLLYDLTQNHRTYTIQKTLEADLPNCPSVKYSLHYNDHGQLKGMFPLSLQPCRPTAVAQGQFKSSLKAYFICV